MTREFMKRILSVKLGLLIAFIFTPMLLAQPTITETNGADFALSGRVAITGTGLGTGGEVFIDGVQAWTATWTDQRVVAYVPEQTALGAATLYLITDNQQSNSVALNVHARQSEGRIKWRFETDGDYQWWRPAEAPDGTLYLHTNNETDGLTYALSPDGGLKWIRHVNWYPYCPPSAGPDGELYVGSINKLYRISPEGQIDWTFTAANAQGIFASPKVGPTGLLHGAFEVAVEAFGINPQTGELVWSNTEANISNWHTHPDGNEISFGWSEPGGPIDRFYVHWDLIDAFSLDGEHLFTTGTVNDQPHEPAIGIDGTIYAPGWAEYYLVAYSPDDGHIMWQTDSDWLSQITDMEIGPDDTLYFVSDGRYMHAFDPHSQSTVWRTFAGVYMKRPTLSPDKSTLVTDGGGSQDVIGFVKAFDTATGAELWNINLQEVFNPNFRHVPMDRARISQDGSTAYVSTWTAQWPIHDGDPRATLFAIAITDSVEINPDSMNVTHGSHTSGGLVDLAESDNVDLSLQRATSDIESRTEFTVQAVSPVANPSSLEVTLEGSVFARSQVDQTIELFDYVAGTWEQVDTRPANRFSDATVTVAATGDLTRFVASETMNIQARIRYQSTNPRQRFSSNTDQFIWTIGQ